MGGSQRSRIDPCTTSSATSRAAPTALDRLLDEIAFSPSRDHVYVLGDLVNRGPGSLATLRRLRGLGAAATCVLGNHDWHLLAVAAGVRPRHRSDTLDDILDAPDREDWLDWVRHAPHGGVRARLADAARRRRAAVGPGARRSQLAGELEQSLRERPPREFLAAMFGNEPARWSDSLAGDERLRFTLNTLTRIRFVAADGTLEFADQGRRRRRARRASCRGSTRPAGARQACRSRSATGRRSAWSSAHDLLGLDTGCVWGGRLTAVRIDGDGREVFQVECDPARNAPKRRAGAAGR